MNLNITVAALLFLTSFTAFSDATNTRIISAGSTVTELLFALEADENVVGIDLTSRHYLAERDIPVLGYHRQLTAEGLLALRPTHLIGSPEMGPDSTLALLTASGVEVISLATGDSMRDFHHRIDTLAGMTNTQNKAAQLKADVAAKMATLTQSTLKKKPTVMFMMLSEGRPITVAGNDTTVNTVIELAGGINPAAPQTNSFKPFSAEAIVAMQPEYILISIRTFKKLNGVEGILKQYPILAATPAIKNGNVITLSGHSILGGFGLASLELASTLNAKFIKENHQVTPSRQVQ